MDSNPPSNEGSVLVEQSGQKAMDVPKKLPSKVQKVVHLWEKEGAEKLLEGVFLAASEGNIDSSKNELDKGSEKTGIVLEIGDALPEIRACEKMFCASCGQEFESRDEQIDHFKSDWHRFNLKRRLKGDSIVTEQKFEEITHAGDLSSISGSDTESDEGAEEAAQDLQEDEEDDFGGHIEGLGRRHPRVFLRNNDGELLSIYRCVIHGKKNQASSSGDLLSLVDRLPHETSWAIVMMGGGHFAGAIFQGKEVVDHKTFHRYVVRAKRGTIQSSRDNKGHAPKSGGATIRRYNEVALSQEIQELVTSWSEHIKNCSHIFLRVPTSNKATLFAGKNPVLDKHDVRIRLIPFQTRRPTFKEVKRVHDVLSSVECYGQDSRLEDHVTLSPKKPSCPIKTRSSAGKKAADGDVVRRALGEAKEARETVTSESDDGEIILTTESLTIDTTQLQPFESTKKPRKKKKKREKKETDVGPEPLNTEPDRFLDPEIVSLRNDLYTSCKIKDTARLNILLEKAKSLKDKDIVDMNNEHEASAEGHSGVGFAAELLSSVFSEKRVTLLHVAAQAGHTEAVSQLLEAGADPTIKDGQGQLPYMAASLKDTRNEFRRFRGKHPAMYDYNKAQIPEPLCEEKEKEKKAKEAARKKATKLSKKERLKDQLAEEAVKREEERQKQRYLSLSDREKRALAADRRFTSQVTSQGSAAPVLSRCYQCGQDMTGSVPFEYDIYKFCTTKCLKEHRLN